jgi:hypothetical protein
MSGRALVLSSLMTRSATRLAGNDAEEKAGHVPSEG